MSATEKLVYFDNDNGPVGRVQREESVYVLVDLNEETSRLHVDALALAKALAAWGGGWTAADLAEKVAEERGDWLRKAIGDNPYPGQRAYAVHHENTLGDREPGQALFRAGLDPESVAFALVQCELSEVEALDLWQRAKTWNDSYEARAQVFRDRCIERAPASRPRLTRVK